MGRDSFIPEVGKGKGMKKNVPKIEEREGNKKKTQNSVMERD